MAKKVVKIEKYRRLPTGITNLDNMIQGGLEEGSVSLVAGGAGSGKTIFAIQYLVNGIEKYGEKGLYITFEEKKKKLYNEMKKFGWDLEKYEKDGNFVFLEYTPEQVKKVVIEGGGIVDSIITKHKIKRLVIDSITSFSLLYDDELSKKEAALALFDLFERWGCTTVLTSQAKPNPILGEIEETLDFEVDSIILLYFVKKQGLRMRAIEILKMRGTKTPLKTMQLDITDKGIVISPNKIVKF